MKGRISSALAECPALGLAWLLEAASLPEVLFFFYTTNKMVTVYSFKQKFFDINATRTYSVPSTSSA